MKSLKQKGDAVVKLMEETLLGIMWWTSEFLYVVALSRKKKKLKM